MCVIAVSERGKRQPSEKELRAMFESNPHGAGYMVARDGKVEIHKGFMIWEDFINAVRSECFTEADAVVYHFRISTQAGVNPFMTHPFPLASDLAYHEALDLCCSVGVAHNGVIALTSDKSETKYSDTSLFIARYMTKLIRNAEDLRDTAVLDMIGALTNSKFAIMDGGGCIATVGEFTDQDGILVSNEYYLYRNYSLNRKWHRKPNAIAGWWTQE